MKKVFLIGFLVFITSFTFGQLNIFGELRPRLELRDGYKIILPEKADPILIISQRSRLGVSYKSGFYTTQISFQDVRIWGQEQINTNGLNIGLHEAWVEFTLEQNLKIKIGRQVLRYDNDQLIGAVNWNQIGAKHDALKVSYNPSGWELDFVGAINQSGDFNSKSPYSIFNKQYKNLGILWVKRKWDKFSLSSFTISEGLRADNVGTKTYGRLTSGLIANAVLVNTRIDARGFYQSGKKYTGDKVNAFLVNLEIKQTLNKKNYLIGGFEIKSGNKEPDITERTDKAFDVLYGGKHNFNGLMDYFGVPSTTRGLGLVDVFMKYNILAGPKFNLNADYHYFKTPGKFQFEGVNYAPYLGSEFDLSSTFTVTPEINITNILSVMVPTSSMAVVKSSEIGAVKNGFYFVTMLTFKPVFFKN